MAEFGVSRDRFTRARQDRIVTSSAD
ncbi:O-methyltransferase, partial [Mycobacteroides abscessus subsp. abscessus]|nr:O-methyltransferase [Mycobacteroides abscessus subsp. abscessus]